MVIPAIITNSWTRNTPKEWDSAGNYQPLDADSDRQDQNARKVLRTLPMPGSVILEALKGSVAEPHHFHATPAPCKNFDAAPAPAPAPSPTLLYTKPTFWKQTKLNRMFGDTFSSDFRMIKIVTNMNEKSKKLLHFVTFLIIHLWRTFILEPSESEPHRVTAPAPPKWCGFLRLRLHNTAF
jgi:hypothetical protein